MNFKRLEVNYKHWVYHGYITNYYLVTKCRCSQVNTVLHNSGLAGQHIRWVLACIYYAGDKGTYIYTEGNIFRQP